MIKREAGINTTIPIIPPVWQENGLMFLEGIV